MKIRKLFKDLPVEIKGSKETLVTGLCADSRIVAPGNLFIAKRGGQYDGTQFIAEAVAAGAVAVLTDIYNPFLSKIVQIIHPDIYQIEPEIAKRFYQHPTNELFLVGITGTNGKTTTSYLIFHLLEKYFGRCGLIGTIDYLIGKARIAATRTTPDVLTNNKMMREMVSKGSKAVVMEVTSHGIDQNRIKGFDFDVAVFTQLTQDHLDYHKNMEQYAEVKSKLFHSLRPEKFAVINKDCPYGEKMISSCKGKIITYGIDHPADLMAKNIVLDKNGIHCSVVFQKKSVALSSPLLGRFNVYNLLAAIGVGLASGMQLSEIKKALASFKNVSGRMQIVHRNPLIVVDFAHTPDALEKLFITLRELRPTKLFCVFGCGGDRDKEKRPIMGEIAQKYVDFSLITSDNPRNEEPLSICKQIAKGFTNSDSYRIICDRRSAIQRALEMASVTDIVVIAGKGHEKTQVFASKSLPFDDVQVVEESLDLSHSM